ncbi:MAG: DUF2799 domain-containing protein [Gammaproteobacteria bacterium]|jgi:hypothetical protein
MPAKHRSMNSTRALAPVAFAALLTACAGGMSKEECQLADWRTIGYEDGVRGLPQTQISGHRKACAGYGVALNLDAYRSGWEEGVRRYCQPGNGYRLGRSGGRYNGVCPTELEPAFLEAHGYGREIHALESEIKGLQHTLRHKYDRVAALEVEMRDTGIDLVAAEMTTPQRVVLLDELRKLQQEHASTKAEIPYIESELEDRREHLAAVISERRY